MSRNLSLHILKQELQNHFGDGLVMIVGSGLSCAESLPGMRELGDHLCQIIQPLTNSEDIAAWPALVSAIKEDGLEAAFLKNPPSATLESMISLATAAFIASREKTVISEVFSGNQVLRLTRLLPHVLKPNTGIPIITTNYDRLVEVAVEEAGLGADTMFVGNFAGQLNPRESQLSFCRDVTLKNKKPRFSYKHRAAIFKPHGSLDWYVRSGRPVRYTGELPDVPRLIITPGHNKFRNGYDSPFDIHREKANKAIDSARCFLILGYGFNDNHLETHLIQAIKEGRPTLLLTHSLSSSALSLAMDHPNVTTLDSSSETDQAGTRVIRLKEQHFFPNISIWDLKHFVTEVLEP